MHVNRDLVVKILREARDKGASEVHFKVPRQVLYRVDGALLPVGDTALAPPNTLAVAQELCGIASLELPLARITDHEFSFGLQNVGRFHATLYRQRGTLAIIVQRSGLEIPRLTALGFDQEAERVLKGPGLTLLCGGRRRGALLAALVDRYNASERGYAVVLEDPLTYLHRDAMATIAQRGVGTDVPSLAQGVLAATRQGADLIACGEIRDHAGAEAVLDAVEHGIPVLACVTAPNAQDAQPWLARHFPAADRELAEERVGRFLRAALCVPDEGESELLWTGLS